MCTTKTVPFTPKGNVYGYKIVRTDRNVRSAYYHFVWKKGLNKTQYLEEYGVGAKCHLGFDAKVFHFFTSKESLRKFYTEYKKCFPLEKARVIRLQLKGEIYKGVHSEFDAFADGLPAICSTQAIWDGKFVNMRKA